MKIQKSATDAGWHVTWAFWMPENRALAGVIRRRRERRGWSLGRLAAESGVSRQMLGGVEDDRKNPSLDVMARIARAFGIPHGRLQREVDRWLDLQPACCRLATIVAFTGAGKGG